MPKDYANITPKFKKKKSIKKIDRTAILGSILLIFLLIILFILLLPNKTPKLELKTKESKAQKNIEQATILSGSSSQKQNVQLPNAPDEKFLYIKELENKQISINSNKPNQTVKKESKWKLQCGAFKSSSQANALKNKILDIDASVVVEKSSTWHIVYLGPFDGKRDAERIRHKLRTIKITGCKIWPW